MITPVAARKAFLDALADGETEPDGVPDGYGYNILCGSTPAHHHTFPSYTTFPAWPGWHNSHAAGRYQFEPATWRGVAVAYHLTDFSPPNQDSGAWNLASATYNARTRRNLSSDLVAGKLQWVVRSLYSVWPSLNDSTFTKRYKAALNEA